MEGPRTSARHLRPQRRGADRVHCDMPLLTAQNGRALFSLAPSTVIRPSWSTSVRSVSARIAHGAFAMIACALHPVLQSRKSQCRFQSVWSSAKAVGFIQQADRPDPATQGALQTNSWSAVPIGQGPRLRLDPLVQNPCGGCAQTAPDPQNQARRAGDHRHAPAWWRFQVVAQACPRTRAASLTQIADQARRRSRARSGRQLCAVNQDGAFVRGMRPA